MNRVALVVDDDFGSKLQELSTLVYVWVVDSAVNRHWAEVAWEQAAVPNDPLLRGVTTFKRLDGENLDELIVRVLDMIDEHHGEFAYDPPWAEVEVIGAEPSNLVVESAAEYGVDRLEVTRDGFRLSRPGVVQSSGGTSEG
jgi:hypothetical protein